MTRVTQSAQEPITMQRENRVGRITLQRPEALHALDTRMCQLAIHALLELRADPAIDLVLIDHAGERGFCAGGDIRMIVDSVRAGDDAAAQFFRLEYQLDELLFSYPKPVVVFMDGVVMGGGVGISLPCRYRIASERTRFAMPEVGIGLFPDVGGSWHLPRLPQRSGYWLATTGARIAAPDCLWLGIATHHVPSPALAALKAALVALPRADVTAIETTLAAAALQPQQAPLAAHQAELAECFAADSVEELITRLELHGTAWTTAQRDSIVSKSPQALKVAFRLLQAGAQLRDFSAGLALEYGLALRCVQQPDFTEGVRATLIDRDQAPRWRPATLAEVTQPQLDALFEPLSEAQAWTPLRVR